MAKIGIALKMIYQGDQAPVVVNPSGWENYVDDNRSAILEFTMRQGASEPMRMITFCPTGMLIAQSINIDGRPSDLESIWLHIPDNADITGEEVRNLMMQANNLLLNKQRTKKEMEAIVARDYPDLTLYRNIQASPANGGVACRYIASVDELDTILGPSRYQAYYKPFKYIALLQRGGVVTPKQEVTDLTSEKFVDYVAVLRPSDQALAQAGLAGARILANDGNGSTKPISAVLWVNQGATLTFAAERPGFAPITWKYTANTSGELTLPGTTSDGWKKQVSLGDFRITSAKNSQPVRGAVIRINGRQLTSTLDIDESESVNADVEVSAPNFESRTRTINLSSPAPYSFVLEPKMFGNSLQVRLANGSVATLDYKSDNPNDRTSPLPGYTLQGNMLVPKPKSDVMMGVIGAVVGALAVGIIWLACWWFFSSDTEAELIQPEPEPVVVDQTAQAIRYLDNNTVWLADSLMKYPATQTLYEELKTYDFSKFNTHNELAQSARYQALSSAMVKNEQVIKAPNPGDNYPEYNNGNDFSINIEEYLNFISDPNRSHLNKATLPVQESTTDPAEPAKTDPAYNPIPDGHSGKAKNPRGVQPSTGGQETSGGQSSKLKDV